MNLKKMIAKGLVTTMAMGVLPFVGPIIAKAEAQTPANAVFHNKTGLFTVEHAPFWGIAKPVKDKKKANVVDGNKYYKMTEVEDYLGDVDVSAFANQKDTYIAYGAANTMENGVYTGWKVKEIKAADKGFKAGYLGTANGKLGKSSTKQALGGEQGYLAAVAGKGGKEINLGNADTGKKLQIKVGNGPWKDWHAFFGKENAETNVGANDVTNKLKVLTQKGANVSVRYAESADHWYKEAKFSVTPQPKAPTLKMDVEKETLSVKKGMEYAVVVIPETGTQEAAQNWTAVNDKVKEVAFSTLSLDRAKGNYIYVREKASKNKILSKTAKYTLKGQAAVDAPDEKTFSNVQEAALTKDNKLKLTLDVKFDPEKGATLTNESEHEYEFYLDGKSHSGDTLPEKAKWFKLSAKNTKTEKAGTAKIKFSKEQKAGTYTNGAFSLFVRKPGVKQEGMEATVATPLVKYTVTFQKLAQTGTVAGSGVNSDAVTLNFTEGEEAELALKYTLSNYQKTEKKPDVKVDGEGVQGVSVKTENFDENGAADIIVKLAGNGAKAANHQKVLKLKIKAEGAADKVVTITFTKNN